MILLDSKTVDIVLQESKEKILPIKKGDGLALPLGAVTWWLNNDETLVVLFLGGTS